MKKLKENIKNSKEREYIDNIDRSYNYCKNKKGGKYE